MTQNVIHPWHQYTKHKRNSLATFPEKYSDYGIVVPKYIILYNTYLIILHIIIQASGMRLIYCGFSTTFKLLLFYL